jgi:geranylgeranyl diphosphate synthase type I
VFEELLTSGDLDSEQIEFMRNLIDESGALTRTESLISEYSSRSIDALAVLDVSEEARLALAQLANAVINRAK